MPKGRSVNDQTLKLCDDEALVKEFEEISARQTVVRNAKGQNRMSEEDAKKELKELSERRDKLIDPIRDNVNTRCKREQGESWSALKKKTKAQAKHIEKIEGTVAKLKEGNTAMGAIVSGQSALEKAETASLFCPAVLAAEKKRKDDASKAAKEKRAEKKRKTEADQRKKQEEDEERAKDPEGFDKKKKAEQEKAAAAKAKVDKEKADMKKRESAEKALAEAEAIVEQKRQDLKALDDHQAQDAKEQIKTDDFADNDPDDFPDDYPDDYPDDSENEKSDKDKA